MDYKKIEEKHYDSIYLSETEYSYPDENLISNNDKVNIASRQYIEKRTIEIINGFERRIELLDFGCAIGEKTYIFSTLNANITGIDISSRSIEIAKSLASKYNSGAQFLIMDCEKLDFPDSKFDIIYNFGTFSSINITNALPEICRVLKDDGYLISIETLGNNPILALKRKLNVLSGSRTKWAADHIMRISDWNELGRHFKEYQIKYFSFLTIFLSPFLNFIPRNKHYPVICFFSRIDEKLLKYNFFKYFAFKTVTIMSKPCR